MSKVDTLNKKIRALGFDLAKAQSRGMRCDDFFGKKLAHSLLLKELYSIEKKV